MRISTLASISAERSRALAWLRHANAPTRLAVSAVRRLRRRTATTPR